VANSSYTMITKIAQITLPACGVFLTEKHTNCLIVSLLGHDHVK